MSNISCEICMDLIPLVQDGAASAESTAAVKAHMAGCPKCRALYHGDLPDRKETAMPGKLKRNMALYCWYLALLGMFFGMCILETYGYYYLLLLLPLIGACSYPFEHKNAFWKMPLILSCTYMLAHLVAFLGGAVWNWLGVILRLAVISVLAELGIVITALLHFAFRREK